MIALGVGDGRIDAVRAAAMHAGRSLRGYFRLGTTLAQVGEDRAACVWAVVEGFALGAYRTPYTGARTPPTQR